MIEPTETESKETLDAFVEALRAIVARGEDRPGGALRGIRYDGGGARRRDTRGPPPDLRWGPVPT